MSLNIKNSEAEELVHRLTTATGESITKAITVAVRERLARVQATDPTSVHARMTRTLAIARDAGPRWIEPYRSAEHGDVLYDDRGLPR